MTYDPSPEAEALLDYFRKHGKFLITKLTIQGRVKILPPMRGAIVKEPKRARKKTDYQHSKQPQTELPT